MRKYSLSDVYSNKNEMSIAQLFKKRINIAVILSGFCYLLLFCFYSCNEPDTMQFGELGYSDIELTASEASSKRSLDSAKIAESMDYSDLLLDESPDAAAAPLTLSSNYALEAVVSAESTYPGYSVQRIKDGSRNTTVGPSYSWANNYPAGGRLPESVFLKFSELKKVDRIDIYTSTGYALKDYTIQYRTSSAGAWTNIVVITNNTSVFRSHTFPVVNLLEIQVICLHGPTHQDGYGRLNEVEIYGPVPTLPSISVENGMLVFSSEADVEQAIEYLEYKYDQYTDAFVAQYSYLTLDQLNDMEETTGFNDEQPYIDFENGLGINSLRAMLSTAEQHWYAQTDGEYGTDPDDLYMADDELSALVNSNGEIKIGSTYYVFLSDGTFYTYTGDPQYLQTKENLDSNNIPENAIYYNTSTPLPTCKSWDADRDPEKSGQWKMKMKIGHHRWPLGNKPGKTFAITKSFKRIAPFIWKRRMAIISAEVGGNVTDSYTCTTIYPVSEKDGPKITRKAKAPERHYDKNYRPFEVWSIHYHSRVGQYQMQLD